MPSSVVQRYNDPGEYVETLSWTKVDLAITGAGQFSSKLTRIALHKLLVRRFSETLPRVAHLEYAAGRALIFFPTRPGPSFFAGTVEVPHNAMIRYKEWDRSFQRSTGSVRLGALSLPITDMEALGATYGGSDFLPPRHSVVVTPPAAAMARLQKIHAAAGALAEQAPDVIAAPDAARGLEQALLAAMADCLVAPDRAGREIASHRRALIIRRFYAVLEAHPDGVLHTPDVCEAIGVSNRTLTTCCNEILGVSPYRYLKLRQLHLVHRALLQADPHTGTITTIATDHGFWDLGRFATAYRELFGELPSVTLRRRADAAPIASEKTELLRFRGPPPLR